MCKFTYLGYERCEEPDRHYLVRREKCTAKAHLKHWCAPHEQEEVAATEQDGNVSLPCPMCADIPIVHDQPLLEIAHSRRSVLPAPYYDAATGKYSRYPRHHAHNTNAGTPSLNEMPTALVPKPLNMARVNRVHFDRSASESAVNRVKRQERSPDYKLPSATYHSPEQQALPLLPATTYQPSTPEAKLPKPLPMPRPMTITPPSSREGSRSPPQSRLGGVIRTTPPGESSRCELDSLALRERAKAAAMKDGTDRSRSGSESSTSSFGHPSTAPYPPPPRRTPSRKPSLASSIQSSTATSSPPSKSNSVNSQTSRRTQRSRQDSAASSIISRFPPFENTPDTTTSSSSLADRVKDTALRTIGFGGDRDRTRSPDRGRRLYRLGSSSERSDSPPIWRPTISHPQLQNDTLGMAPNSNNRTDIVQAFKQRLVPFAPSTKAKTTSTTGNDGGDDAAADGGRGGGYSQPRPKTPHPMHDGSSKTPVVLRLYPNEAMDEKVAMAAFNKMFNEEQKALLVARRHGLSASSVDAIPNSNSVVAGSIAPERKNKKSNEDAQAKTSPAAPDTQTLSEMLGSVGGGDPFAMAGVGRSTNMQTNNKAAPAAPPGPQQLRRVKTGQVKTVTVGTPVMGMGAAAGAPRKRAYTSDVVDAGVLPAVKVKTEGPFFSFAGVGGGMRAQAQQEFEIVSRAF